MTATASPTPTPAHAPPPALQRRQRRIGWALLLIGGPLLLLGLLFGLPVVGNFVGLTAIPALAECSSSAGSFDHCWLWGRDLQTVANGYAIGIFLLGIMNPMLFLMLLNALLHPLLVTAWFVASLGLLVLWLRGRRALRGPAATRPAPAWPPRPRL